MYAIGQSTLPSAAAPNRRLLRRDEASAIQMRDNPLGDDRRHDVGGLCLRQAAIMRKCERQGCEKVLPIDREKLLGSVALVGHAPTLARPRERTKNKEAQMSPRGAGAATKREP